MSTEQRSYLLKFRKAVAILILLTLAFIVVRGTLSPNNDLVGYVIAGNLAWNGLDLYSNVLNTWPPSFSVICLPLYGLSVISTYLLQFVWIISICLVYLQIFRWVLNEFYGKKLSLTLKTPTESTETLNSWIFIVCFLLGLRVFVYETIYLQINVLLMGLCLYAMVLINREKIGLPAFIIALTILCKAYTLILFPFFIFRNKVKLTFAVLGWLAAILVCVSFYFGMEESLLYHQVWWEKDVISKYIYGYGNQSIWSFVTGLVCNVERIDGLSYNILKLDIELGKRIALLLIGLISLIIGLVFIKTYRYPKAFVWQYIIVLAAIPVFSPLAWKHYYVFLMPLIIFMYQATKANTYSRWVFIGSLLLINLTSPLLIGHRYSDIFETLGVFALSSLAVIFTSLFIFYKDKVKIPS